MQLYRSLRNALHPARAAYVGLKARLLPSLLPLRERLGVAVLAPTPAGHVRLVPRGSAALMLLANGRYEPDVIAFLVDGVRDGAAFLDVGANAGIFSLAVSRAHPDATIYAFEPASDTFAILGRNITLNSAGNVHAVRLALGERSGEAVLYVNPQERDGLNTLLPTSDLPPSHAPRGPLGTETVPLMRLDDFLDREEVGRVGLVKIDVEGAEVGVLRGAIRLLAQDPSPTVVYECWSDHSQDAASFLAEHGYEVRDLTDEMKVATKSPTR